MEYANEMIRPTHTLFREMQYVLGPVVRLGMGYRTIKTHRRPRIICDTINRITGEGEILSPECPNSVEC